MASPLAGGSDAALCTDVALAADPVLLARAVGIEPYEWAVSALRSPAPREAWVVTRQGSKSTTASIIGLHCALFKPRSTVLLLSPGLRQSAELFRKLVTAYRQLGRPVASKAESATALEMENGSRVVSLPGTETTVRSYAADLVLVDEAARVSDAVWDAVRPMVAVTGGRIVLLSTPWEADGFFWRAATGVDGGWVVRVVPADQIPTISPDFLAAELASMGKSVFAREYLCDFAQGGAGLFTLAQLRARIDPDLHAPLAIGG